MELSLRNIGCPACFEILVEPVTTPCNHNVCKICLEKTFENNKFNCIVCRKFLGSWVRSAKSKNRFVNEHLWNNIKQQFGSLVDKRLNDEDYEMPDNNVPHITVSTPGELGKEFEEEAKKMRTELEKLQEEYNKRSLSVIEKMQQEEEIRLKLIEEDERIARSLMVEESEKVKKTPEQNSSRINKSKLGNNSSVKIRSVNLKTSKIGNKNNRKSEMCRKSLFSGSDKAINVLDSYFKRNEPANILNNNKEDFTSTTSSSSSSSSSQYPSTSKSLSAGEVSEIYRALYNDGDRERDNVNNNNNDNSDTNDDDDDDDDEQDEKLKAIKQLIKAEEEFLKNKEIVKTDYELIRNLRKLETNSPNIRKKITAGSKKKLYSRTSPRNFSSDGRTRLRNVQTIDALLTKLRNNKTTHDDDNAQL